MAARKRKRSRRRRSRGLGMEPTSNYLTVERAGAGRALAPMRDTGGGGGPNRLLIGGVVLLAAAGAGWFIYKKFFDKPATAAPGWVPGGV